MHFNTATEMYHTSMKHKKQHWMRLKTFRKRIHVHAFSHIFHTQFIIADFLYVANSSQRFHYDPCKFTSHDFIDDNKSNRCVDQM